MQKGTIDLSLWDFEQDKDVQLNGEWEFYWNQLISPEDLSTRPILQYNYTKVPASWTNLTNPQTDKKYPPFGYATYRVHILLPKKYPQLSIYIPKIWTASRVWMNEKMIYQSGNVSTSIKGFKNRVLEKLVEIYPQGQEIDLIVQVSNYDMFLAGLLQSFRIGSYAQIMENISLQYSWTMMWLGILFAMGIYHFILFLFRRRRKSTFYFGIICLLLGLRLIIFGEHYFYEYLTEHIGWLTFNIQSKTYYGTTFLLVPISLLYMKSLYPVKPFTISSETSYKRLKVLYNHWNIFFIPIASIITGLYLAFVLVVPPRIFLATILYYQPILLVFLAYLIFLMFAAIFRREHESYYQIIGMLVMLVAAANDGLHQLGYEIFGAFEIMPLAFVIFLSIQFIVIAKRFSRAFKEVEDLSGNLEKKVIERTAEVTRQKDEIEEQNKKIELAYKHITDSVVYASRIQKAMLLKEEEISRHFKEAFIYLRPRDIVSGDFYWFAEIEARSNGKTPPKYTPWTEGKVKILIAADCTGHGVPGAFMTVMGNDFLNEIILEGGIINPEKVICELDQKVYQTLTRKDHENTAQDGMDLAMIALHESDGQMIFSGAKNPMYLVRNGEMRMIEGSKYPVGGGKFYANSNKSFEPHPIILKEGDVIYLASDGFQDQFGGKDGRKYMKKRFREFLHKISPLPMNEQKTILEKEFENWKGKKSQTDDVLVVGIRI